MVEAFPQLSALGRPGGSVWRYWMRVGIMGLWPSLVFTMMRLVLGVKAKVLNKFLLLLQSGSYLFNSVLLWVGWGIVQETLSFLPLSMFLFSCTISRHWDLSSSFLSSCEGSLVCEWLFKLVSLWVDDRWNVLHGYLLVPVSGHCSFWSSSLYCFSCPLWLALL